eukprot:scaffold1206_cov388-Prasinococcus_capsulatus_cf.AAC.12
MLLSERRHVVQELHAGLLILGQALPDRLLVSDVDAAAHPERTVEVLFERVVASERSTWAVTSTLFNAHTLKVGRHSGQQQPCVLNST